MLVKKGDFLVRNEQEYKVVCADDEVFIIGKVTYYPEESRISTSYENLEAYSNDESVNTLQDLKFTKTS